MNFDDYQARAISTAIYPNKGSNLIYPVLGLVGEAGEVAEKTKKLIRDYGGVIDDQFIQVMAKELGDVLWYIAAVAFELGLTLDEIAETNISKLASRKERGVIQGSGDDR